MWPKRDSVWNLENDVSVSNTHTHTLVSIHLPLSLSLKHTHTHTQQMTEHRPTLHKSLPSKRSALDPQRQIGEEVEDISTASKTTPQRKINISQLVEILTYHDEDPASFDFQATSEKFKLNESDLRKLLAYVSIKTTPT